MFGYVRPYLEGLSEEEKTRYRSVYCGICRSLARRYGRMSRLTVNYDMTFLALVLSSLYEPEETISEARCEVHPLKPHAEAESEIIDYAADMTIVLAYYKCLDDWQDEHKRPQKAFADLLRGHFDAVNQRWPDQCREIRESIQLLSEAEKQEETGADSALSAAGMMLSGLFVWKKDFWEQQLRWFGDAMGRFVYLMDAAMDYEKDVSKGCYNPLRQLGIAPEHARKIITQPLGEASEAFERLPLVQDDQLMRNIIYSGVWQSYNQKMNKTEETAHGQ
ncbi:MAG: hypothetical protein IJE08_01445 [Clostridia bacterium]|nr:hypothetical protein [Clostridia bacterium]